MNFIFTKETKENLNQADPLKEFVLVQQKKDFKEIQFYFPLLRFDRFSEKYQNFLKNIQGTIINENITNQIQIRTLSSDYDIYINFVLCFY